MVLEMKGIFDQGLEYLRRISLCRYLLFSVDYIGRGAPYTYLLRLDNERVQFD